MSNKQVLPDVVITGIGIVSPLGIGSSAVANALGEKKTPLGRPTLFPVGEDFPVQRVGEVPNFNSRSFVQQKKALKVSKRNIHLALVAGRLAWDDAGLEGQVAPERIGVIMAAGRITAPLEEVCFAMYESQTPEGDLDLTAYGPASAKYLPPYWFLRHIPNLVPAHIAIELGLQGPANAICVNGTGGLIALDEAVAIIQRGDADVMMAGGAECLVEPNRLVLHHLDGLLDPRINEGPSPFTAQAQGTVLGEAGVVLVLERKEYALARGRKPLAQWRSFDSGAFIQASSLDQVVIRKTPTSLPEDTFHVLCGLGFPAWDQAELNLSKTSKDYCCYRSLVGWSGVANGPHDLACALITARQSSSDSLQDPGVPTCFIPKGKDFAVQSIHWSGQYARAFLSLL